MDYVSVIDGMGLQRLDVIGPKPAEFGGITQNNGRYAVHDHSRSFKVTDFGTKRKPICDSYY